MESHIYTVVLHASSLQTPTRHTVALHHIGNLQLRQVQNRGREIHATHQRVTHLIWLDAIGPSHDKRNAKRGRKRTSLPSKVALIGFAVTAQLVAVVAYIDHDCIVCNSQLLQTVHHTSDLHIHRCYLTVIHLIKLPKLAFPFSEPPLHIIWQFKGIWIVHIQILLRTLFGLVRRAISQIVEPGTTGVAISFCKVQCHIRMPRRLPVVAFDPHPLAILVVVPDIEKLVPLLIPVPFLPSRSPGTWLNKSTPSPGLASIQMPLPDIACGVSSVRKQIGKRDQFRIQQNIVHIHAVRMAIQSGLHRPSKWGTHRAGRGAAREPDPLRRQTVQIRRFHLRITCTTHHRSAMLVRLNHQHIRIFIRHYRPSVSRSYSTIRAPIQ